MTELYEQFKKDHPETVGETDKNFDNSNYIDWLELEIQSLREDAKLVKQRLDYHFKKTDGSWLIPNTMPFMKEFLNEVNSLLEQLTKEQL